MTRIRKQYSDQFKFKVALEAIKGLTTITVRLNQQLPEKVNRKRVVRLMRKMGLQAIYAPIKRPRFLTISTKSTPIYCGI